MPTAEAVDLKATLRRLCELTEKPKGEFSAAALALCFAQIGCAVEDDAYEVPADAFAELTPVARKVALAGLVHMLSKAME